MSFNFDEYVDRSSSESEKWQKYAGQDILPLWVADTDFRTAPAIIDALHQRTDHGVFGYPLPPDDLAQTIVDYLHQRYQWQIQPEWLLFLPSVVCGLHLSVRALTTESQTTIAPHPIYPFFMQAAESAGRRQLSAPLKLRKKRWVLDLNSLESQLAGNEKLLMLCNPQNPAGTVYRREELIEQLLFAQQHNLYVCSDEIHCDLLMQQEFPHIPFATLNEDAAQRSVTLMSPSKTYNIAGTATAFAVIPNSQLRARFSQVMGSLIPTPNIFAYAASNAAYKKGQPWLEGQLAYLRENHQLVLQRINAMHGLKMMPAEATYLAWIDTSALPVNDAHHFFEQAGVGLSSGKDFGNDRFVRLNFGCQRALLLEALDRMEKAINQL